MVVRADTAPCGRIGVITGIGVGGDDFGDVVRLVSAVLAAPEEVEQSHSAVFFGTGDGFGGHGTSQRIDGGKGFGRIE